MHGKRPKSERTSERGATGWADCLADGRLPLFLLVCLGVWMTAVDTLVTATIMPSVGADLGGYAYFGWVAAGFMLGVVVACASAGRLSEIVGLRRATGAAGLVFAAGCLMNAAAPTIEMFVAGRLVQGIGGGWISGFAMVTIGVSFPERHLARVFAATAAIWGTATILGPLIGGIFAEAGNWRGVFWFFAVQGLIFAGASAWLLRATERPKKEADSGIPWKQIGTLALGIGVIGWANVIRSPGVALPLAGVGFCLLVLVLRIDAGADVRLLPRDAGSPWTICGSGYIALFALTASSMGLTAYGPAILQELRGLSPLMAGYTIAAMALAWTGAAFTVSAAKGAERHWIRFGGACIAAGTILLALVMQSGRLGWIVTAILLMGAGFGFCSSLINRRVLRILHDEDRAIGSSALVAVRQAGGAFGAAIAGVAANLVEFDTGLTQTTARAAAVWVFCAAIPFALIGAGATWQLTRKKMG